MKYSIIIILIFLQALFTVLWLSGMVPQQQIADDNLSTQITFRNLSSKTTSEELQLTLSVPEKKTTEYPVDCSLRNDEIIYPIPIEVEEKEKWRYSSKGLYWTKCDTLYYKALKYNATLTLPPGSVKEEITKICKILESKNRTKLCRMFKNCFPNTLETTLTFLHDGTSYIITGDIPLMWLRDSSAQVFQYINLARTDPHLQIIIEGAIRRDIKWIKLDPYGSSFRLFLDHDLKGKKKLLEWDYQCGRTIHVAMHDWELDSLCYFIKLSYDYWRATGIGEIFDQEWKEAAKLIIETMDVERNHKERSKYRYPTLKPNGDGKPTCQTGLIWTGMRPSDDSCYFHFLIPSNMFAVVSLRYLAEIFSEYYLDEPEIIEKCKKMAEEIDHAIHKYALVEKEFGKIYAYEVNGCGDVLLMDDANVPSLLSIPYLNYTSTYDPDYKIYKNTRKYVLSKGNEYFFQGKYEGIGSPHTNRKMIWPMSIIIQAMTSEDNEEINKLINVLEETDDGKEFIHESFNVDDPHTFSRSWFAWANSLFSELILQKLDIINTAQR